MTIASATVTASVNPDTAEVTSCQFEYGPTSSYGSTAPCASAPGSGETAVQVIAALSGLAANTTYHFRISAGSVEGTTYGADQTFTTLQTSSSGEATEPTVPAAAVDGGLSVTATGGTGTVTVGHYGTEPGGTLLAGGKGPYSRLEQSEGSTFTKIEYKDCELGGARTLWWDDPVTGWEPLAEPTAIYDESTHCITVTLATSSHPSIGQLSNARYAAGPSASEEYGRCMPTKDGHFEDGGCTKETFREKGRARRYDGSYEWLAAPNDCYPQKHGRFGDSVCSHESYKENGKTHSRKYLGNYEQGSNVFTGSGGAATIEAAGSGSIECQASSFAGTEQARDHASLQLTFTGCASEGAKCTSAGQAEGAIITEPLESYTYEEGSRYVTVLGGSPLMSFDCGRGTLSLSGAAAGQLSVAINTSASSSTSAFGTGAGEEDLELEDEQGTTHSATLTTTLQIANAQAIELRAKPY